MKKILFGTVVFMAFFVNIFTCKAVCNDDVLLAAKDVKVEAIPMTEDLIYYVIKISNLTPDVYVTVYEDDNETTTTYTYDDSKDGVIEIEHWYIYEKVYYTVNVYSTVEGCADESLNEIKVNTKKFNERYGYVSCEENPDYEKCHPFYEAPVGEEQTDEEFYEEIQEYNKEQNMSFWDKVSSAIREYYLYVLVPIVVVGIVYGVLIYVYKAKKGESK